MAEEFTGYPVEGLDFLRKLGKSDKAWFDESRPTYNEHVVAPTKAFVVALGEQLNDQISPTIEAQPKTNGSIAPINNDLRFSKDKSPYKDHLLLRFWDGPNKKVAPTLMVRIAPDQVGFSCGAAITSVDAWRTLIDDDVAGSALVAALAGLRVHGDIDMGEQLKRVPKPFTDDHPRADLLRHKGVFHVRWAEPTPPEVHSSAFTDFCIDRLLACAPLFHWFQEHRVGVNS